MIRIRQRPAGFDARSDRPSSLRAQAQRVFRAAAERSQPSRDALRRANPLPEADVTPLTQRVRALYEDSVVPVGEIARLAGVNERTLYRYVQKGQWRRRYGGKGIAAGVAKRAAKRKPRACVTAKGTGGRFIPTADADKPFARGLKALDPPGGQRALEVCELAAVLSDDATARTRRLREAASDARTMALLVQVMRDLAAIEDAEKAAEVEAEVAAAAAEREHDESRRALAKKIEAAVQSWKDEAAALAGKGG
jgi:hypothetical protein